MLRVLVCVLFLGGCAAPFVEVDAGPKRAGSLELTFCGASTVTAGGIIRAMDEPPVGPTDANAPPPPGKLTVCLRLANQGAQPARVDRSHLELQIGRSKEPWEPDRDDEVFIVPPGESRKFQVTFEVGSLLSGEDVLVRANHAVTVEERPVALPPVKLRRR
jgi:hypothetical protein